MDVDNNNSSHTRIRQLISTTSLTYLRQMAVQYGSIELDELVLEALDRFFPVWSNTLTPAQRAHVKYSDPKWVGAGFWLCAMARNMTVKSTEKQGTLEAGPGPGPGTRAGTGNKSAMEKKIGGRGGKELKEMILTAVEHRVQKAELDKATEIMEDHLQEFLMSLGKPKRGRGRGGGESSTPSTPGKQKASSNIRNITLPDEGEDGTLSPGGGSTRTMSTATSTSRTRPSSRHPSAFAGLSAKRQISNVSQLSMASETDDDQGQNGMQDVAEAESSATRPSKRKKLDSQEVQLSSADIMSSKKKPSSRSLKETTAASQDANRLLSKRRKTGGVYSMVIEHPMVDVIYEKRLHIGAERSSFFWFEPITDPPSQV